jgi:hypothetical protein
MRGKRKLDRPGAKDASTSSVRRPLAPRNVSVTRFNQLDERGAIAKANQREGMHMFYGDRKKDKEYLAMGYKPVVVNGEAVHHKGDPLYTISKEVVDGRRRESELMSVSILEQARQGQRTEDTVHDSTGEAHRVVVVKTID